MKSAISNSNWYKLKVQKTISGYKDLHKEYSEKIQLRFNKYEIPASVLITEKSVFVEPYIMARRDTRSIQGLNTFEVQVSYNNSAWKNFMNTLTLFGNCHCRIQKTLKHYLLKK